MTALLVMGIALCAAGATFLGGLLALSLRERVPMVLGFSAGAVIGVAFFDLLPEALAVPQQMFSPRAIVAAAALGFFLYVLLDRLLLKSHAGGNDPRRAMIGAGSFSAHSLLDGFSIGIAFQAGQSIGLVVAAAVLVHDFSDGLNTVNVVTRNGGSRKAAIRWLAVDAGAPVIGAGLSLLVSLNQTWLALLLGGFAGFFLYIGASDLLPESQRSHPDARTALATVAGAGLLYIVTTLAL